MRPRLRAAAVAVAAVVACAGCGGGGGATITAGTAPPAPDEPTGYFVGRGPAGLGISVDLLGSDPVSRDVLRALLAGREEPGPIPVVAVASIVNDSPRPVSPPRLVAVLADGTARRLVPAGAALAGASGPEAERARGALGASRAAVPAEGARVEHLVLRGAAARDVMDLRARGSDGEITELSPRRR